MTFPADMEPGPVLTPATHARETYDYHATQSDTCPAGGPDSGLHDNIVVDSKTTRHITWASWIKQGKHLVLDTTDGSGYTNPPNQTFVDTGTTGPPQRIKEACNAAAIHVDLGPSRHLHRGMTRTYRVSVQANEQTADGSTAPYSNDPVKAKITISVK